MTDKAYAMDVNRGPLERASENIRKEGLNGKIRCILSDGMEKLPMDADSAVIAGMGGDLMEQILMRGEDRLFRLSELVLSPQSHWEKVRRFLHSHESWQYSYGTYLTGLKDPLMKEYLTKELNDKQKILDSFEGKDSEHLRRRAGELSCILREIKEALKNYEMQ